MIEVIIGDLSQYKLREDGSFFSRVISKGRGGAIIGDAWIEKKPIFGKCDYKGGGYYLISLSFEGKTSHRLHRLVARFFVDGFKDGLSVNHIDGDRKNNSASNLEWVTHKQNMRNAIDRGAMEGVHLFKGNLSEETVLTIITLINAGKTNPEIAKMYNTDLSTISKLRNKKGCYSSLFHLINNPLKRKYYNVTKPIKPRPRDDVGRFFTALPRGLNN